MMPAGGNYFLGLQKCIANGTFFAVGQAILSAGRSCSRNGLFRMGCTEEASASVTNGIIVLICVRLYGDILGFVVVAVFTISAFHTLACMCGFFRDVPGAVGMSRGSYRIYLTDFFADRAGELRVAVYCAGCGDHFGFTFIATAAKMNRFSIQCEGIRRIKRNTIPLTLGAFEPDMPYIIESVISDLLNTCRKNNQSIVWTVIKSFAPNRGQTIDDKRRSQYLTGMMKSAFAISTPRMYWACCRTTPITARAN